jgi:predicted transposase/invertase (TIGR01784 family)
MQFLNPTTDFAFKKIFGSPESADILLSFLNAVLNFQSPYRIASVTIQDPYLAPKILGMKDSFVDVRATDEQGKHYIIEMQILPVHGFEQRVLYNSCKKYAGQIQKGDDYRLLNDVIALTITDFTMFEHTDMVSKFKLRDESGREYSDDLELIFVELPKFIKQEAELSAMLDKWCYFLRHAKNLRAVPGILAQESSIAHAFVIANRASLSEEELELQERREMFIQDQRGAREKALDDGQAMGIAKGMAIGMAEGVAKGMAEGVAKGMAEGVAKGIADGMAKGIADGIAQATAEAKQKTLAAAQNLKAMGLDKQQIAAALNLPLADLADL